jgi:hypothetical protein
VRHELLPALEAAAPGFSDGMLAIADQAASWRREVERFVDAIGVDAIGGEVAPSLERVSCPADALERTSVEGRGVLWPAICARAGVTLDAKGTRELVKFTTAGRRGSSIRVSGGALVLRRGATPGEGAGDRFEVRRMSPPRLREGPGWRTPCRLASGGSGGDGCTRRRHRAVPRSRTCGPWGFPVANRSRCASGPQEIASEPLVPQQGGA